MYLLPPGFPNFPDGLLYTEVDKSRKSYVNMDVNYHVSSDNKLLFGVEYYDEKHLYYLGDKYRRVFSLFSQYEFQPIDDLSFTLGLRYDEYSDIDNKTTPRFAAVYRLTSNHIFKFQYANAFRPPTTIELVTEEIKPSIIETYELTYTYKSISTLGKICFYHSSMKNAMDSMYDPIYYFIYFNIDKVRSRGIELDIEHNFWNHFKFKTSTAYMYSKNYDSNIKMPLQTNFIGNAGIIYNPFKGIHFSTKYLYVGKKSRELHDDRKNLDANHKLNASMTISVPNIRTKIRLGMGNILNEDIRVPTPTSHLDFKKATYLEDYPRHGRVMWFDITREF